jgi:hypothetical protein
MVFRLAGTFERGVRRLAQSKGSTTVDNSSGMSFWNKADL